MVRSGETQELGAKDLARVGPGPVFVKKRIGAEPDEETKGDLSGAFGLLLSEPGVEKELAARGAVQPTISQSLAVAAS